MENNKMIKKESEGFFSKIKKWFNGLFGKNKDNVFENKSEDIEVQSQSNVADDEVVDFSNNQEKIKYEFTTPTVSKQKIEKIRLELDNGKIGYEELYQLSDIELEELEKSYDNQINDTILKLHEVTNILTGYQRKLSKLQNLEQ